MITGQTKNLGVIGYPIAHSLSPAMQNAALRAAGLDYVYIAMPVAPDCLKDAVNGLRSLGFRGFNVTIPHKTAIIPLLDEIDEDASLIGAVNTVVREGDRLIGHNTDVSGFIGALRDKGFSPRGKRAVLLGAGGAARAVVRGLLKEGVSSLAIGVRNPARAQELVRQFSGASAIAAFDWQSDSFRQEMAAVDLLVNTTPLGMFPRVEESPPVDWAGMRRDAFVYDIIYTPEETRFLRAAAEHGCPVLNGVPMLVGQGAAAFRLWTGQAADQAVMRQALREALGR